MIPQILGFTAWSSAAVLAQELVYDPAHLGLDSAAVEKVVEAIGWGQAGVPFGAIAALSGALAIFLGFRNSSAYDRWWEARKIWGGLVNDSRSWARQCVAWCGSHELARELVHRHLAFVHGLALHLRARADLIDQIAPFLPEEEVSRLRSKPNVPAALLIEQGIRLAAARDADELEHFRHLRMDDMLVRLSDIHGKCERIKNTPVPRQYDEIPRTFVYFYGLVLPFGLAPAVGWASVVLCTVITGLFLLLERSGRVIENPFDGAIQDTPMTALSITIERDLRAALGEPLPDPIEPDELGVLM